METDIENNKYSQIQSNLIAYIFEVNSMSEQIDSEDLSSAGQECQQQHQQQQSLSKKSKKNTGKNSSKNKIVVNISDCQYPVVSRVAKGLKWKLQAGAQATDWDVFWTDNAVQPETLLKMEPYQKINHFPGMFNLARKNLMGRYLMKMRKKFSDDYSFFPMTWMLPVEYHQLRTYFQSKPKGKARTFIVKPEALSQGKGIFLTRKLQEIDQNAHCVVQRYMHRPYLIQGLKFDLRVYVLVASVDPLRLYIYHEGLTRFATEKYEPPTKDNMEDVCMHLTNYAINKDNPKFVFNSSSTDMSKGHKRSLTWLLEYLQKNQPKGKDLKLQIEDMIVKTMISGLPVITNTYRSCQPENYASNMCFQLLGFDVMLTDKCEPVLLEINHTPSFTTDTPLDDLIKTNYIRDSLVLMNINSKTKDNIIRERREACQQRVITGKKVKLSNEEKETERRKMQAERDKYESKHLGGFKKIYPLDDEQKMGKYQQFLNFSQQNYLISTGTKKGAVVSKKTQKIQNAFGTCFKPKQTAKTSTSSKNRETAPQLAKKTAAHHQKKYQTKKIITGTSLESDKKKMTHSQNLISPKSLGEPQQFYQLQLVKGISGSNESQSQQAQQDEPKMQEQPMTKEPASHNLNKVYGDNTRVSPTAKQFATLKYSNSNNSNSKTAGNQAPSYLLGHKNSQPETQFVEIIAEQTEEQSRFQHFSGGGSGHMKIDDMKLKKNKFSAQYRHDSPKQRESNQRNLNNVQIFFDSESFPQTGSLKRTTNNENTGRKTQHIKLGIFGINQITSQNDRKKFKTPGGSGTNPKSMSNIQNWDSRPKDRHLSNREKIPILLNTLLIGGSEGSKPALSANNLRKILNNISK